MSSGLSERRRDRVSEVNMNPPKRLRAAGSGAETPRGEQGGERSAVDVVGDGLIDSRGNADLKQNIQQKGQV